MELLHMSKELPLPVALPALPAAGRDAPRPVLKSTSLARMEELQHFLRQCDDKAAVHRYYKMLSTVPQDVLVECARRAKDRAAWLAAEEQREYKRAKLLHVMGNPCSARTFAAPASPSPASADADAFASEVLAGSPEKRPDEGDENAPPQQDFDPALGPLVPARAAPAAAAAAVAAGALAAADYATPLLLKVGDGGTALRHMQQEAGAQIDAGLAAEAATFISPPETSPLLAAVADQRISPEGAIAMAGSGHKAVVGSGTGSAGLTAAAPSGGGGGVRSRQGTLRK